MKPPLRRIIPTVWEEGVAGALLHGATRYLVAAWTPSSPPATWLLPWTAWCSGTGPTAPGPPDSPPNVWLPRREDVP